MGLLEKFFKPDIYIDSISELNLEQLIEKGIKVLLADLDNTLSSHGSDTPDSFAIEQINRIKESGLKCIIYSNARSCRAKSFSRKAGVEFIGTPAKPSKKGIRTFYKIFPRYNKNQVAIIGDQIFTDVLTGKRSGLFTVLVKPLYEKETSQVKVKRRLEEKIKKHLKLDLDISQSPNAID